MCGCVSCFGVCDICDANADEVLLNSVLRRARSADGAVQTYHLSRLGVGPPVLISHLPPLHTDLFMKKQQAEQKKAALISLPDPAGRFHHG